MENDCVKDYTGKVFQRWIGAHVGFVFTCMDTVLNKAGKFFLIKLYQLNCTNIAH